MLINVSRWLNRCENWLPSVTIRIRNHTCTSSKKIVSIRLRNSERSQEKHGMRYTPYRGLKRVSMWVRLKFAAMNLKKLAMWRWKNNHTSLKIRKNNIIQKKNLYFAVA